MLRSRARRHLVTVVVCLFATALGTGLYFNERDTRQGDHVTGDIDVADRVQVEASVQKVDPTGREIWLRVLVLPMGALRENGDDYVPAQDLVIETSSLTHGDLRFKAGERISEADIKVGLDSLGGVSDYPFDRYDTRIAFYAQAGGRDVPLAMRLRGLDPFFTPTITERTDWVDVRFKRTRSTLIFAFIMMAVMWALALAVLAASWVLIEQRRGLVWPALGWMAATLFALVGFRNAAPGSPPIGSLLDYTAFLWAEAVVSVCVVAVVVFGVRVEKTIASAAQAKQSG